MTILLFCFSVTFSRTKFVWALIRYRESLCTFATWINFAINQSINQLQSMLSIAAPQLLSDVSCNSRKFYRPNLRIGGIMLQHDFNNGQIHTGPLFVPVLKLVSRVCHTGPVKRNLACPISTQQSNWHSSSTVYSIHCILNPKYSLYTLDSIFQHTWGMSTIQ